MADLKKREKMLVGSAVSSLVIFLFNQFVCGSGEQVPEQLVQQAVASANKAVHEQPVRKNGGGDRPPRKVKRTQFASWGRDPFYEAGRLAEMDSTRADSGSFVLRGIIWKGKDAHALIGDAILKKGESNGEFKVLDIQEDKVVCKKGTKVITLTLRDKNE